MGKRKVYVRTDLSVPQVEHSLDQQGRVVVLSEAIPPARTLVAFGRNTTSSRNFDFSPWYGTGIDQITYACQKQIERFLVWEDATVEVSTVVNYCRAGLHSFLDYLVLRATALGHELALPDIDRELIDGYLGHLAGRGVATTSQKRFYDCTKSVLQALGQRGLFTLIIAVIQPPSHATLSRTATGRQRVKPRYRRLSAKHSQRRSNRRSCRSGATTRL